jgi:predicted RNase H-like HicB family nuclease
MAAKRKSTVTPRRPPTFEAAQDQDRRHHEAKEGGYWVQVPGFGGCLSEGKTLDEVRANIREAFEGVFEVMQDVATEEPGRVEETELCASNRI